MITNLLAILIGAYIVAETIAQLAAMHGGKLCRIAKYVLAGVSGLWLVWVGISGHAYGITLVLGGALALFIWPRTWIRLENFLEDLWHYGR